MPRNKDDEFCPWERPRRGFIADGGTRRMAYEWSMKGREDWSATGYRSVRYACGNALAELLKGGDLPHIESKDGRAIYRRIDRGVSA